MVHNIELSFIIIAKKGASIAAAAKDAVFMVHKLDKPLLFIFNDILQTVDLESTADSIVSTHYEKLEAYQLHHTH